MQYDRNWNINWYCFYSKTISYITTCIHLIIPLSAPCASFVVFAFDILYRKYSLHHSFSFEAYHQLRYLYQSMFQFVQPHHYMAIFRIGTFNYRILLLTCHEQQMDQHQNLDYENTSGDSKMPLGAVHCYYPNQGNING
jgi:hypothetical protein